MEQSVIAVTGASGFIGRALCARLKADGRKCLSIGRSPGSDRLVGLNDGTARWTEVLRGAGTVVHLASGFKRQSIMGDDVLEREIVLATESVAKAAAAAGVRRFVFLSMAEVYGAATAKGSPFGPKDRPQPPDWISTCKLRAEDALKAVCYESGMESVVVRSPLVYGAGAPGPFGQILERIARGKFVPLGMCSGVSRSFIGIDNLVDLLCTCIDSPAAARQTLNAGDSDPVDVSEFIGRLAKAAGRSRAGILPVPAALLKLTGSPTQGGYARLATDLELDWSETARILGWQPPVPQDREIEAVMAEVKKLVKSGRWKVRRR